MKAYFITSCGTNIGKTFITSTLCWHFSKNCKTVKAIKPIISGWEDNNLENDTIQILRSLCISPTQDNIEQVSPWRLKYPYAPNVSAKIEKVCLNYDNILNFCTMCLKYKCDYLFIEGIGGVMSPITNNKTCLDLIRDLKINVILVIGAYLGSISHTLTALKTLQGIDNIKIILTLHGQNIDHYDELVCFINNYCNMQVYIQNYISVKTDSWKYTSDKVTKFVDSEFSC
ncbi:dethiobiotin synthase [Neoehrlichia mikurensis]|uniref:ATP-dependent dethiobiotin synthetase BioD n=1 Tax=Neoehrlichia mikurensis TaxID=89586 RepID=A0A9Q9BTJ4_9RICK|nr:dethiobiotin synthase [Neoehrlichia mikurensis]UTO55782.1 dethiobiotin synthase [Neoehrlichia mikurensis]UTO56697.1 dethiobiotin synthase [Neoehrlichia mikurensis]